MEPAVTPSPDWHAEAGVTLIELVVVLMVLASLGMGVTLSLGRNSLRGESDLIAFQTAYDQARSLAVHGQIRRGLLLEAKGRRLARWQAGGWQLSEQLQPWRGRVSFLINGGAPPLRDAPNLIFLPNGQTTAFSIQFDQITCRSDGWTGLICAAG